MLHEATVPTITESKAFGDSRGRFSVVFAGESKFLQLAEVKTYSRGTVRGLHWQAAPFEQRKLVRVLKGAILDVVVDLHSLRVHTFIIAAGERQLAVPLGFAHGYQALDNNTIVQYLVDAPYSPQHERGLCPFDPAIDVPWPYTPAVNERDRSWPLIAEAIT